MPDKLTLYFVLLLLLFSNLHAFAQSTEILAGIVLQPDRKQAIPGAVVSHVRNNKSILADGKGRFLIKAAPGDSLLIRAIGYKPFLFVRSSEVKHGQQVQIVMQTDTVMLKEVEVIALPSLRDLQHIKYQPRSNVKNPGYIPPPEPKPRLPSPTISGPIGALYSVLSKEGKEIKKLKQLHEKQKSDEQEEAKADYNKFFKDNKGFE